MNFLILGPTYVIIEQKWKEFKRDWVDGSIISFLI